MSSAAASASASSASPPEMAGRDDTMDRFVPTTTAKMTADQRFYACDPAQLKDLQTSKPWTKDPTYFTKVAVSPSAVTKMMMHCASGVSKGIAQGGNPIEVMGLLLGRPDPTCPTTLVVADAFALPIEGFETRVVADDQDVVNHMIALTDCLGRTRREHIMGWYHSHPFDLEPDRSHCFLSQTDLSTQLLWQRAEDPQGNPFVAVVVDPLRSQHLGTPQLKAFRAFPPEYASPVQNQCPDGTVQPDPQARLEQWGSCWNRYYELQVEYYMSSASRSVLGDLTQNYLWMAAWGRSDDDRGQVKALEDAASALGGSSGGGTMMTSTSDVAADVGVDVLGTGGASGVGSGRAAAAGGATHGRHTAALAGASGAGDVSFVPAELETTSRQLQTMSVHEMTQAQLRQVQKNVFAKTTKTSTITTSTLT